MWITGSKLSSSQVTYINSSKVMLNAEEENTRLVVNRPAPSCTRHILGPAHF